MGRGRNTKKVALLIHLVLLGFLIKSRAACSHLAVEWTPLGRPLVTISGEGSTARSRGLPGVTDNTLANMQLI